MDTDQNGVCFLPVWLQIDLLAEITQSPRVLSEVDAALKVKQMKTDVDEYLKVCRTFDFMDGYCFFPFVLIRFVVLYLSWLLYYRLKYL